MKNKIKRRFNIKNYVITVSMFLAILTALAVGAADFAIPETRIVNDSVSVGEYSDGISSETYAENEVTARVHGIPLKSVEVNILPKGKLIPCGSLFGVKFFTKGVMVVGMSDIESDEGIFNPAYMAGIRTGDVILEINGLSVNTVEEVSQQVDSSDGAELSVVYEREGESGTAIIIPIKSLSDGKYKTGLWVRDSTAGIGTITYYNPETGCFGGLGHGICDVDTGKLMPMLRGNVVDITVNDIVKGIGGEPGEIKGSFGNIRRGVLDKNSEEGVFGVLSAKPECAFEHPVEVASKNDIHEGEAFIYCSLGEEEISKYAVKLTKIYRNDLDTKNFIFEVTDKNLLDKTGGIVQGMSGSPVVQNNKLIGAVTHVLVNDPTRGYGIFIENMLAEAEKTK